ncbi:D-amino acid dehydrogenase [Rhodoferax sediminis]|jgi:D-amino-acid dehydrogenase|uniref:FAD-dependent oxidoreductase n=1 Tax=Rhodoferax sediminis TaxID=2509614 RepID=A0A515DAJ2_9BURK|nr:D-amino acid dehydrogenase [Rhodoferax sediminis]QDL37431.1 FAD-dependent oxidoreductase [Rhodoferax sediminis]
MKIAIIGAGIIGVTTAYELAADGHEVTVFERHAAAAEEASFATAGMVAPGSVTPWAAPGMPAKVMRSLLSRHAAVRIGRPLSAGDLAWIWKWRRACKLETYLANRARLQRLAFYSSERLRQLSADLPLEYERSQGYLMLLRSGKDQQLAQPALQVIRDAGVAFREVDAAEARRIEPALNADTALAGAIHLPRDEVGNCRQFAMGLKIGAQLLGASFLPNTTITRIGRSVPATLYVAGEAKRRRFDTLVLCAGVASASLLKPLGLSVPIAPVYGYSISAHIREPLNAPLSAVMDERYQVAITRLGQRVRVAGGAEIGGAPGHKRAASLQTLYKVLHDWFPGAAQLSGGVQEWKGARPMLPDGPPVLGASGVPGLWLNIGHGASGWALSCGSARVVADLIAGRAPAIDLEGLDIERLLR